MPDIDLDNEGSHGGDEADLPAWDAQREADEAMGAANRGHAPLSREDLAAAQLAQETQLRQVQAAQDRPVSFGRQMLQLVLIPALIVGGIMAVWVLVITLGGEGQSLDSVLRKLETSGGGAPAQQERARSALSLLSIIEDESLSAADRATLVETLPALARTHRAASIERGVLDDGADYVELTGGLLSSLALLADPATLPVFEEFLASEREQDWLAAASGLYSWRGDMAALRSLVPRLLHVLQTASREALTSAGEPTVGHRVRLFTVSVLGAAADPDDAAVRDALAREMNDTTGGHRDVAWNAGLALAVMGDARGVPVLASLLDREWLVRQPLDPLVPAAGNMDVASIRKVLTTAINVAVGYDPRAGGHVVRVDDPEVWRAIEKLAENDPDAEVRTLANAAMATLATDREATKGAKRGEGG